ncbi:MAG TPA: hypothetical protein VGN13_01110 [Solirubrobacteraceae bacterium]
MSARIESPAPERVALLEWTARIGAVTAEALARRDRVSVASARARLLAAGRDGLLRRERPLNGHPALYTVTRPGLRAAGIRGGPGAARIGPANARHAIVCADVAVALECAYPDHRVSGERELRREEQEASTPLASAVTGTAADGRPLLHRPDLVLRPDSGVAVVAVEVELTVKAPQRLLAICRAWARSRCVHGVLYVAARDVQRPLGRAIAGAAAEERIALVTLSALRGDR